MQVDGVGGYGETPSYYSCVFFGSNLSWADDLSNKYMNELKNSEIGVKFIDFLFPISAIVESYSIIVPNKPILNIEGNIITDEAINLLKKAKRKDIIIINSIHTNYMNGYGCHQAITPLIFQITQ